MYKAFKLFITAKGVKCLILLAVLFFLLPSLALAQGLKLGLEAKGNKYSYHKPNPAKVGLSLAFKKLPLLQNRIVFNRNIDINYEEGVVELNDKLGAYPVTRSFPLSLSSYMDYTLNSQYQESWKKNLGLSLAQTQRGEHRSLFEFDIPVKFPSIVSKFIGEGGPSLKITGNRRISFSGKSAWQEGVQNTATYKPSKWPSLNMEQTYNFRIDGSIGSKIFVDVIQDSRSKTDLENRIHLKYVGEEDEILQSVEAGNTTLSVGNSLVSYAQAIRGLFGIKAQARLGRLNMSMITSQEKSSTKRTEFKAGAESSKFTIRDYNYYPRRFYYLGRSKYLGENQYTDYDTLKQDFQAGDSIGLTEFWLYKSITNSDTLAAHGLACVDPTDTSQYREEKMYRKFVPVDEKDYYVYRIMTEESINETTAQATLPYVQLFFPLGENEILAYYAVVTHENGEKETIGSLQWIIPTDSNLVDDTTFLLKLLKPEKPKPQDVTWEYEWRNVYSLQSRNIDKDGLVIDVYKGISGAEKTDVDQNHQNGVRYLQMLGLDRYDQSGNPGSDGIIDFSQIDFEQGLLFFPDRHPFATKRSFTGDQADTLIQQVPVIYNSNLSQDRTEASTYYISVETKSRRTEYSLGQFNIIEGSEVVTLNGKPLAKGRDYNIDYQSGQITFLTQEATDPTADIRVDYEYAPFISAEKKSLYGFQADYNTGSGFGINTVALYKSEKSSGEKFRVGEEPKKNFVWGTDLSLKLAPSIMTKMADALPLFGTEDPSNLDLSFKIAQSIPNPNVKDKAYIDDFEGSLQYTDLTVLRYAWTLSSLPEGDWQRSRMIWYNPYEQVKLTDIWPNYQVEERDRLTHVLSLKLYPNRPHAPIDTKIGKFDPALIDKSCNGIMRAFGPGSWNQTRTRFLEIWMKGVGKGVLRVDLGEISEDINGDEKLDTEDKEVNGQRDGILDEKTEDTGLDGTYADDSLGVDWSGDNWSYNSETTQGRGDYSQINGTQGNAKDPDRGYRLDTEDINYNDILEQTNSYFEFTIDLSQPSASPYYVPGQYPTGWVLYRIPLQEIPEENKIQNPSLDDIRFARLWLSTSSPVDTSEITVQIASIKLVGNRWLSAGTAPLDKLTGSSFIGNNKVRPGEIEGKPSEPVQDVDNELFVETYGNFDVFVINTYENADYEPPPGIAGILDRQTGVREREQSLALKYEDLKPRSYGMAERYLLNRAENYTNYQELKMYVHGPEGGDKVKFFYRMGTDPNNFYEYQTWIYPGWDDRNEVVIDFGEITALKNYMLINAAKDSMAVRDTTEENYRIKGSPSLSSVRWFAMGVYNESPREISGEIWVDELRVTDVRKIPGWYYTGDVTAKFADLANLSITYSRKDSEFRGLTGESGSGVVSTGLSISLGTSFEKFLPSSWGLSLPFSFRYLKSVDLPRLKPGSDIVLPEELRLDQRSESISKTFSFSPAFRRDTNNWLLKLTLKRLSLSQAIYYSRTDSRIPSVPVSRAENYGFGLRYDMTPGKNLTFSPFKGLQSVFLLKKLSSEAISLLPTKLVFNSKVTSTKSFTQNDGGVVTSNYIRDLIGTIDASMSPLKTVQANYSFQTNRDIRNNRDIKFSFLPKKAQLGIEISRTQSFTLSYRPKWVGILDQNFSFNSSYRENADPKQLKGTRNVGNGTTKSANFTFYWQKLFGILKPKGGKEGKGINPLEKVRGFIGNLSQNLSSLTLNYRVTETSSKSGLLERPSLAYQFGFSHKIDVPLTTDAQNSSSDSRKTDKKLDLSSGLRISSDISLSSFRFSRGVTTTATSGKPIKNISQTFPDLGLTWNRLEKFRLLRMIAASASYSFGYSKRVNTTEDGITHQPTKKDITTSFAPLFSLNMTLKNGIQTNWKWDRQKTENQNLALQGGANSKSITTSETYGVNTAYSFSAPKGIKLPFLKRIKFQSSLNLSMAIDIRHSQTKSSVQGQGFVVSGDTREFSLTPRASYSFSSQVSGGLSGRWLDAKNNKTGEKRHTRELSLWVEIRF
jgi:hypothetical protein